MDRGRRQRLGYLTRPCDNTVSPLAADSTLPVASCSGYALGAVASALFNRASTPPPQTRLRIDQKLAERHDVLPFLESRENHHLTAHFWADPHFNWLKSAAVGGHNDKIACRQANQ